MGRKIINGFALLVIVAGVGFALWTWGALSYVYSTGERAGYVQKFSRRGWVFKTWEGEMAMVNLPGAMPEKFFFSVRDEAVAKRIEQTLGHRVVIRYNQHIGIPSRIFGDTSYFAAEVRPVEEAVPPASLPAGDPGTSTGHSSEPRARRLRREGMLAGVL